MVLNGKFVPFIVAAACIAMMPGALMAIESNEDGVPAPSLTVDKVFAIDSLGSVHALLVMGEDFDSGNLMSLTLAGKTLEIEWSSGTEIVAMLPDDLAPGPFELAVSVRDDVQRIDQAVAIEISLPASGSAAHGKSRRLIWSSAENPLELAPVASTKALSGYTRRSYTGSSCPDNYFCWRRVGCPSGYRVSGGGMAISGTASTDAYLVESFPYSTGSWEARVLNQSGTSRKATTWAICVR